MAQLAKLKKEDKLPDGIDVADFAANGLLTGVDALAARERWLFSQALSEIARRARHNQSATPYLFVMDAAALYNVRCHLFFRFQFRVTVSIFFNYPTVLQAQRAEILAGLGGQV